MVSKIKEKGNITTKSQFKLQQHRESICGSGRWAGVGGAGGDRAVRTTRTALPPSPGLAVEL